MNPMDWLRYVSSSGHTEVICDHQDILQLLAAEGSFAMLTLPSGACKGKVIPIAIFSFSYAVMFEMSPVSFEQVFRFESLSFLPCQKGVLSDKNAPFDILYDYDVDERERLSLWQPCRHCMRWRLSLRHGKRWYGCHSESSWWRHQMETFSALLAICAGNSPVPVNSPHKGQWRGALMFFYLCVNKRLSKQSRGCWFETPASSLWRHCNVFRYSGYHLWPIGFSQTDQIVELFLTFYTLIWRGRKANDYWTAWVANYDEFIGHVLCKYGYNNADIFACSCAWYNMMGDFNVQGSLLLTGINFAWISYYIHYKLCDELTYLPPNFNGAIVEVWEWISKFIPHVAGMWLLIHAWIKACLC